MGLFRLVKKWLARPPDVLYVPEPPCQLTLDMQRELRKLKAKADRLKADDDKRRLLNTMEKTQGILEELESRIHADSAYPARSIRG
jgi:hypothetical protein